MGKSEGNSILRGYAEFREEKCIGILFQKLDVF